MLQHWTHWAFTRLLSHRHPVKELEPGRYYIFTQHDPDKQTALLVPSPTDRMDDARENLYTLSNLHCLVTLLGKVNLNPIFVRKCTPCRVAETHAKFCFILYQHKVHTTSPYLIEHGDLGRPPSLCAHVNCNHVPHPWIVNHSFLSVTYMLYYTPKRFASAVTRNSLIHC